MSMSLTIDMASLNATVKQMEEGISRAVRPAAQAAAQVFYDEVCRNVDRINSGVGKSGSNTGNLRRSIYQKYWEARSSKLVATYRVGYNHRTAPHGFLVEFGHISRYAAYLDKRGNWKTAVRKNMRGKKRPSRKASQAVKDAYYVLRPGGPLQIAAQPFIRPAYSAKLEAARKAAIKKFAEVLNTSSEIRQ